MSFFLGSLLVGRKYLKATIRKFLDQGYKLTNKQVEFDSTSFINDLHTSVNLISLAEEIGSSLASREIKRLYLVGCGAPYYMFRILTY